jgi:hypothetical protein
MKNLLILIVLATSVLGCKKKRFNVIKYKVGSIQYYSAGNYSSALGQGNTKCILKNGTNRFSGYDENSNSTCSFYLQSNTAGQQMSDSAIAGADWFLKGDSIPASIYLRLHKAENSGKYSNTNFKSKYKTISYTILQDTPDIIEGTFEGKVYTDPKDPMLLTSDIVQIRDGYFCIPKTK